MKLLQGCKILGSFLLKPKTWLDLHKIDRLGHITLDKAYLHISLWVLRLKNIERSLKLNISIVKMLKKLAMMYDKSVNPMNYCDYTIYIL